jgi:2-methylcitrate dehydratase PrpD
MVNIKTVSSIYADFITQTRYGGLPSKVVDQAKQRILDLVGVSLAGYKLMEFPQMIVNYMASLGGLPEATIFQTKKKFPAIHAAFANGTCAHAIDMDDGHRFAASHPATVIVPAALAAAEMSEASTKELITGVVIGYEIMIRIGNAINPSSLNRGFHTTGITGTFGAAAAVANIMKLDVEEAVGALGLAGLQSAGLLQVNHDMEGAKVKPINPARAATSGLLSCILTKKGARGPSNIFQGEDGFLKAFTDEVKEESLTHDLGETFEISKVYDKFYAACRHAHAAIDAALEVSRKGQIDVNQIEAIAIETYPVAIRLAGITHPSTPSSARFSIPFSVALALIKKDVGADKYSEENIHDEKIQKLAQRVVLSVGDQWEKTYPNKRGATVRILDRNKKEWSAEVELAKGEPENPASWGELYDKFFANATLLLSEKEAKKLGEVMIELEKQSIEDFIQFI